MRSSAAAAPGSYVIYGGIIILLARFRPGGLIGLWQEWTARRTAPAARRPAEAGEQA